MIYYLAGPMAGYADHNHPNFREAATALRQQGYTIVNPADYGNLDHLSWQTVMKRDIHALLWCDAVIVLPGWEESRGAKLETDIARRLEMPIYRYEQMVAVTSPTGPAEANAG